MLKEMEFVQEWMAECRQEGLFQGREEGRQQGRQEGIEECREEGREEGVLIGRIEFAGQLLGRPLPSRADLLSMRMEELQALAAELDGELRR
jgi:predicted transposase YdaD